MASLGGYTLRGVKRLKGREGVGFEADLHKGAVLIAHLKDWGDGGGVNTYFNSKGGNAPEDFNFVLEDMRALLSEFTHIEKGALCETFTQSPRSAAEAFCELLLELKELENSAKKQSKVTPKNVYYAVTMLGNSWFKGADEFFQNSVFSILTGETSFNSAVNVVLKLLKKREARYGSPVSLAVLMGDFAWDLTFQDYANLFEIQQQ